jgi:hypothetical protein
MNLRVFSHSDGAMMLEVSSPSLDSDLRWFVPLLERDLEKLQGVSEARQIRVTFQGRECVVAFMLIRTVRVQGSVQPIGTISLEDSINVLNNIIDRLAYD